MRHQSEEGEKRNKTPILSETRFEGRHPEAEALTEDEIDSADFFDPEEFGFRRRGVNASLVRS